MVTTLYEPPDDAPLINCDDERALLRDLCARAAAGHGQLVLIGGEAGIGKTTLARTAASGAPEGSRVLIGHSYDLMETPPYGPWRESLRRWPEGVGPPAPPFGGRDDAPQTQEALFSRVQATLITLARTRPLILILDNIQWADPASLDLLRHIAHDLATRRILILCTYRTDELTATDPLAALLPRLLREAPTTRLILSRFAPALVTEMVAAQFGAGQQTLALSRSVYRTTAGNPLFVREMCRALIAAHAVQQTERGWTVHSTTLPSPPETLRELVAARIARLAPAVRRILEVAAIFGQTFTFPLLQQVLDASEEATLEGLEEAADAHIIAEDDSAQEQYRFTHPVVHEVLYHAILATRRRQWHRRIGEAIEGSATQGEEAVYDRLAYHFGQARDGARAVHYLTLAGDAAMYVFAFATATEYYEQAMVLLEPEESEARDWLLLQLARTLAIADPPRSRRYAEEALRGFSMRGDQRRSARVRWLLSSSHWRFGKYAEAEEQCRLAMRALRDADDDTAALACGPLLLTALRDQGKYRNALQEGEALLARAEDGMDRDTYHHLQFFTGHAHAALGNPDDAYGLMQQGLEGQRALNNPYTASNILFHLFFTVSLSFFADRGELLADFVHQHGELAERGRAQEGTALALGWFLPAYWAFLRGEWERARQDLLALPDPPPTAVLYRAEWAVCAAQFALAEGRASDGIALIQRQLPPPGADWTVPHRLHIRLMSLLAQLSLADNRLVAAKQALDEGAALLAQSVYVPAVAEHHLAWTAFYRARGQAGRALTSATTARDEATAHHDLIALVTARRVLGELAMERGAWQAAATELAHAAELVARIPTAYERAAVALAQATLHVTRTDAPDIAPLGAPPLVAALDDLRARLHAINPAVAYGITAREADVLRHLVAGASNQEIADILSISRRTVDQHVSSILGKLGVTNRVGATSLAIERGLVPGNS
jgi:DNA-binding CsgD family transcriptional regulator